MFNLKFNNLKSEYVTMVTFSRGNMRQYMSQMCIIELMRSVMDLIFLTLFLTVTSSGHYYK